MRDMTNGRIRFRITQEEYDELVALNRPGANVTMQMDLSKGITIVETKTVRQLVNEWWQRVGDKYGIAWNTARLDPDNPPFGFTADPVERID